MRRLLLLDEVAEILRLEVDDASRLIASDELDAVVIAPGVPPRVSPTALHRFVQVRRRQFRPFAPETTAT
jgi:hypothetical protein